MSGLYTDIEILEFLGDRVKTVRLNRKITQQELADFCGVNRRTIVLFEKGKGISLLSFIRILRFFDLQEEIITIISIDKKIDPFEM